MSKQGNLTWVEPFSGSTESLRFSRLDDLRRTGTAGGGVAIKSRWLLSKGGEAFETALRAAGVSAEVSIACS